MIIDKNKIQETVDYIESKIEIKPEVAIILGSGLGAVVDLLEDAVHIPYSDIPNFPVSTVKGHSGRLAFGTYGGKNILVQEGRVHFYEGLGAEKVMYPLFVMKALGVKIIINTNAAGGINPDFSGGDLMLIQDHINFMSMNPLTGPNDDSVGPRFPDLRFLGITFISNLVSPTRTEPLTHKEVTAAAAKASGNLAKLIGEVIKEL